MTQKLLLLNMAPERTGNQEAENRHLSDRERRVVLVCDVVESVRWMEQHEDEAISRWSSFSREVRERIAPAHHGMVVKSTGDGLMMEFASSREAVLAGSSLHALAVLGNRAAQTGHPMQLRVGINNTDIRRDGHDIYGHGVNLAARVAALAEPGTTVITAEVRDQLTDTLDGEFEDLGECYLKHVTEPSHVYQVGPSPERLVPSNSGLTEKSAMPKVLVIPMRVLNFGSSSGSAVAELLTDSLIQAVSRQQRVRVVSKLASHGLTGRVDLPLAELARLTGADYVVSGSVATGNDELGANRRFNLELTSCKKADVLMARAFQVTISDLLMGNSGAVNEAVADMLANIDDYQFKWAALQPVPTLPAHVMLSSAIHGMHRRTPREFDTSRKILEALAERYPRSGLSYAWLAKWHILKVGQGGVGGSSGFVKEANQLAGKAVSLSEGDASALTMQGIVQSYLTRDYTAAGKNLRAALELEPSNALAMLYLGGMISFSQPDETAVQYCKSALELSLLDPTRYLYDGMLATTYFGIGQYEPAIVHAKESLRRNRAHGSALRVLAMSLALAGREKEAKSLATELLRLSPGFNRQNYLERFDQSPTELQLRFDAALEIVGIPKT